MQYGQMCGGGRQYEVLTPNTPIAWQNQLFNDSYYLELDQSLQGGGYIFEHYGRTPVLSGMRLFYIKDQETGDIWSPNMACDHDAFSCRFGMGMVSHRTSDQGIDTSIEARVPISGTQEVWTVTLSSSGKMPRKLSLFVMFSFYDHGVMGGVCRYQEQDGIIFKYAFPYHTLYEEQKQAAKGKAYAYLFSDQKPASAGMSQRRFFGSRDASGIPEAVRRGILDGIDGEAEDFCGAFSFDITLMPGTPATITLEAGAALDPDTVITRKSSLTGMLRLAENAAVEQNWDERLSGFTISTPDKSLNALCNWWLKKQMILLSSQNRGSSYCPTRNRLQDAMGHALIDPKAAADIILDVMRLQTSDGFLLQWHEANGSAPHGLCCLHHTDAPVWLVICTEALIRQLGDAGFIHKEVPYADGGCGTVLDHLKRAVSFLQTHLGSHGMCLMGDGDWNDPINGVGRLGRGESVWLTMALVYATKLLLPYLAHDDPDKDSFIRAAAALTNAVNRHAWDGHWYCVGFCDDGQVIGDYTDRLFLNTQSWAIMSGIADAARTHMLMEAVKSLETPFGPLILNPPFTGWDARWGRISVKQAGTTENGSVYCHGSMFMACAMASLGNGNALYDILWRTLPTNPENPPEKNLQIPTYLANYYFGLRESPNFGRSSSHYGTGTTAWFLMLTVEKLLGVKATVDGLQLEPCLPDHWPEAQCTRRFRDAVYDIHIRRGENSGVWVDARPWDGATLPCEPGHHYQVELII